MFWQKLLKFCRCPETMSKAEAVCAIWHKSTRAAASSDILDSFSRTILSHVSFTIWTLNWPDFASCCSLSLCCLPLWSPFLIDGTIWFMPPYTYNISFLACFYLFWQQNVSLSSFCMSNPYSLGFPAYSSVYLFQPSTVFLQQPSSLFRSEVKYHYGRTLELCIRLSIG